MAQEKRPLHTMSMSQALIDDLIKAGAIEKRGRCYWSGNHRVLVKGEPVATGKPIRVTQVAAEAFMSRGVITKKGNALFWGMRPVIIDDSIKGLYEE